MSDQRPTPTLQQQQHVPTVPSTPISSPVAMPPAESREFDRRVSTGMVGLPSDFNAMELTSALRGVSLPVLERFALDQPFRKPRPLSPPELSPKQLPRTVTPSNGSEASAFRNAPVTCLTASDFPVEPGEPDSADDEAHIVDASTTQVNSPSPTSARHPKEANPEVLAMPPPPLPRAEVWRAPEAARHSPTLSSAAHNATQPNTTKQPCQVCSRMRQQVSFAKAQGLPTMHHGMPQHLMTQMAYHQPYSQHLHPQMITMGQNNMHAFGSGFTPIMMPINGNHFAALPSHMPNPTPMHQHGDGIDSQPSPQISSDQHGHSPMPETDVSNAVPGPVKPPASLIQPTYRKPSPNLIVDVAETCQERFPFDDVAKRHNVAVEKVFDVFAAIIQVPLLRCPTDRRRAGKLATTRVKEYTKAKKAMQETSGQGNTDPGDEMVVKPLDIANRLGQVDFPDGFNSVGP